METAASFFAQPHQGRFDLPAVLGHGNFFLLTVVDSFAHSLRAGDIATKQQDHDVIPFVGTLTPFGALHALSG